MSKYLHYMLGNKSVTVGNVFEYNIEYGIFIYFLLKLLIHVILIL